MESNISSSSIGKSNRLLPKKLLIFISTTSLLLCPYTWVVWRYCVLYEHIQVDSGQGKGINILCRERLLNIGMYKNDFYNATRYKASSCFGWEWICWSKYTVYSSDIRTIYSNINFVEKRPTNLGASA